MTTAPREVTVQAPARQLAPIDESVVLPRSVTQAAEIANSFYQPAPGADAQPDPAAIQQPAESQPQQPQPEPQQPAPAQAQGDPQPAPQPDPAPAQAQPDNWEHRYNSMKGRYDQALETINLMQGQMTDLGNELMRTQAMIGTPQQAQQPAPLITAQDVEQYGSDMLDVVQRAAVQAVQPELKKLESENEELRKTIKKNAFSNVNQTLDQHIPNWKEINRSREFKQWLSLLDIYSGQVRGKMLNAAYQAADAPRVVAFFQGFLQDLATAGHVPQPQPQPTPQPAEQPAREPAVQLASLAAPGRPRPASGGTQITDTSKPSFTRQQVQSFYNDVRRGAYAGRDADKNVLEQQIFAAQREGRIK